MSEVPLYWAGGVPEVQPATCATPRELDPCRGTSLIRNTDPPRITLGP
jgi:hypothetical protein